MDGDMPSSPRGTSIHLSETPGDSSLQPGTLAETPTGDSIETSAMPEPTEQPAEAFQADSESVSSKTFQAEVDEREGAQTRNVPLAGADGPSAPTEERVDTDDESTQGSSVFVPPTTTARSQQQQQQAAGEEHTRRLPDSTSQSAIKLAPMHAVSPSSIRHFSAASSAKSSHHDGHSPAIRRSLGAAASSVHSPAAQSNGQGQTRPSNYLLTVVPPQHLPHDPPHPKTNPSSAAYGPPEHFRRGTLIPLHATLAGQLGAIAREYSLPSTGGMVVYLLSATDPHSASNGAAPTALPGSLGLAGEGGPRIGDEAWQMLWGQLFEPQQMPDEQYTDEYGFYDEDECAASDELDLFEHEDPDAPPPVPPLPRELHHLQHADGYESPATRRAPKHRSQRQQSERLGASEEIAAVSDDAAEVSSSAEAVTSDDNDNDESLYSATTADAASTSRSATQSKPPSSSHIGRGPPPTRHASAGYPQQHARASRSSSTRVHSASASISGRSRGISPGAAASFRQAYGQSWSSMQPLHSRHSMGPAAQGRFSSARSSYGARTPSAYSNVSMASSQRSFGPPVIVGRVEFDIDRRRGGRGANWYNTWVEQANQHQLKQQQAASRLTSTALASAPSVANDATSSSNAWSRRDSMELAQVTSPRSFDGSASAEPSRTERAPSHQRVGTSSSMHQLYLPQLVSSREPVPAQTSTGATEATSAADEDGDDTPSSSAVGAAVFTGSGGAALMAAAAAANDDTPSPTDDAPALVPKIPAETQPDDAQRASLALTDASASSVSTDTAHSVRGAEAEPETTSVKPEATPSSPEAALPVSNSMPSVAVSPPQAGTSRDSAASLSSSRHSDQDRTPQVPTMRIRTASGVSRGIDSISSFATFATSAADPTLLDSPLSPAGDQRSQSSSTDGTVSERDDEYERLSDSEDKHNSALDEQDAEPEWESFAHGRRKGSRGGVIFGNASFAGEENAGLGILGSDSFGSLQHPSGAAQDDALERSSLDEPTILPPQDDVGDVTRMVDELRSAQADGINKPAGLGSPFQHSRSTFSTEDSQPSQELASLHRDSQSTDASSEHSLVISRPGDGDAVPQSESTRAIADLEKTLQDLGPRMNSNDDSMHFNGGQFGALEADAAVADHSFDTLATTESFHHEDAYGAMAHMSPPALERTTSTFSEDLPPITAPISTQPSEAAAQAESQASPARAPRSSSLRRAPEADSDVPPVPPLPPTNAPLDAESDSATAPPPPVAKDHLVPSPTLPEPASPTSSPRGFGSLRNGRTWVSPKIPAALNLHKDDQVKASPKTGGSEGSVPSKSPKQLFQKSFRFWRDKREHGNTTAGPSTEREETPTQAPPLAAVALSAEPTSVAITPQPSPGVETNATESARSTPATSPALSPHVSMDSRKEPEVRVDVDDTPVQAEPAADDSWAAPEDSTSTPPAEESSQFLGIGTYAGVLASENSSKYSSDSFQTATSQNWANVHPSHCDSITQEQPAADVDMQSPPASAPPAVGFEMPKTPEMSAQSAFNALPASAPVTPADWTRNGESADEQVARLTKTMVASSGAKKAPARFRVSRDPDLASLLNSMREFNFDAEALETAAKKTNSILSTSASNGHLAGHSEAPAPAARRRSQTETWHSRPSEYAPTVADDDRRVSESSALVRDESLDKFISKMLAEKPVTVQ